MSSKKHTIWWDKIAYTQKLIYVSQYLENKPFDHLTDEDIQNLYGQVLKKQEQLLKGKR